LLGVLLVTGCASGRHVRIDVTPATSLPDQSLHIRVFGLHRDEVVTVRIRARDTCGRLWRSGARFRADGNGALDLDRQAPLGGTYRRVWGDGLLASLSRASVGAFFVWSGSRQPSLRVEVLAHGNLLLSRAIRRRLPKVEQRTLRVARTGFYGRYYAPPARHLHGVPVLVFGGSEGGLSFSLLASVLALHGHPTLALAYFNAPGLPQTLSRIRLEYFARALRWLRARPEAGGRRVAVIGVSRGSEAAQLLGVHYPRLVRAVVASVPSNSAICDLPFCSGPAWTFHGRAIPYTRQFDFTQPDDNPAAVIPVERIRAPLLLVCGGRDAIWRSCPYMHAIVARRTRFGRSSRDVAYAYPDAGHFVGSLLPYVVVAPRWLSFKPADERGRQDLWPHVLSFLARG
jgi:pimeloyl-ACP methyl ester carboxylesterase